MATSDRRRFWVVSLGCWVVLSLLFLNSQFIQAQVAGASLSGTVSDPSGSLIPGAKVSIENLSTGVSRDVITDKNGYYSAPNLLPGDYEVAVSASGFATQIRKGVTLTVGGQVISNFEMKVGAATEKVDVTVGGEAVQTTSSDVSATVNSTTVRELPLNGRSWTDLATLQPGVARLETAFNAGGGGTDRGIRGFGTQLSVSGGKPVQNNYRLDGVSVNDYANGGPGNVLGSALGVDAVQEFSVITSNYSAEYGRTSGGVINAITKSGTNAIHGTAFDFLRNSVLDARNYFDYDPVTQAPTKSPFRRNQFGGSIGGPIRHDSTFFFADYEGIRQSKGVAQSSTVPSDTARTGKLYSPYNNGSCSVGTPTADQACQVTVDASVAQYLPFWPHGSAAPGSDFAQFAFAGQQVLNEDFATTRIDRKLSSKDGIYGTFLYDRNNYSTPDALDQVLSGHHIDRKALIVEETHVFSPTLLNSARFGYSNVNADINKGISAINQLAANTSLASTPGQNATRVNVGGIASFGGGVSSSDHFINHWKSFQGYDDAFLTHGAHSIKFGAALERMHSDVTSYGSAAGLWNFNDLPTFLTNTPASFQSALGAPTPRNIRQTIFGVYVQDDWRARSNLTLNLGLRYEVATVPSEENGKFAVLRNLTDTQPVCGALAPGCAGVGPLFSNPTLHNFEPRVGLAWDVSGNGKTAIRAGFGMFDVLPLPYAVMLLQYRPAPFYLLGGITPPPQGSFYTGAYNLLTQNSSSLSATYIQPNPSRNYVMQWNLNVQRQLTANTALMVGYVGNHGVHQQFRVDDANMNLPTLTQYGYLFPLNGSVINPNFTGGIRSLWFNGGSSYNALETTVVKRMSRGLQMQGSFTWGKAIDNSSAGVGADSANNSIPSLHWYDLRLTKAPADYDIRRTLSINALWDAPSPKQGVAFWLLGGWEIGGIFTVHDGLPFTPLIAGDPLHQNSTDPWAFPDRLTGPGCSTAVNPGNVQNYIKTECFAFPTAPSLAFWQANCDPAVGNSTNLYCANLRGNAGRNSLIGPGYWDFDFSLFKNIPVRKLSDAFKIQFRAEFFNVANHTNFQAPTNTNFIFNPDGTPGNTGTLQSTVGDSREIQFGLKLVW